MHALSETAISLNGHSPDPIHGTNELAKSKSYSGLFHNHSTAVLKKAVLARAYQKAPQNQGIKDQLRNEISDLMQEARLAKNTAEFTLYDEEYKALSAGPKKMPMVFDKLGEDFVDFFFTFSSVSKMIDLLGYLNIYRLISVFARLTWQSVWALAQAEQILDAQGSLFGVPINRGILDASVPYFNALSVLLFFFRLLFHGLMILKHGLFPTEAEEEVAWWARMAREIDDRKVSLLNDLVWIVGNFLTNYPQVTQLPIPVLNAILGVCLLFDSFWLLYQCYEHYCAFEALKIRLHNPLDVVSEPDKALMMASLHELQIEKTAELLFCFAAGILIMSAYLSVVWFATPLAACMGFFACVSGFGMYLSAGKFATYYLKSCQGTPDEAEQAGADFALKWAKSTFVPLLTVGLFTVSTPAAIAWILTYSFYEHYASVYPWVPPAEEVQEYEGVSLLRH